MANPTDVTPDAVHDTLRRHMLVDGFDLVLDTKASQGSWIVDARDGSRKLDMFSFFASAPLGMNHPGLVEDPEFMAELAAVAANKPSNSDIYTTHMAAFVDTFARVLGDPALPHLFFVEGGALAVENALKTAFDWKRRHNAAHGRPAHLGTKVLHLRKAFHGRSGYTLSLTNTDPVKTALFPTFDWPRIDVPALRFPIDLDAVEAAEARALEQARAAFAAHPHDIACFIAEPIQGEGGDNHLRAEFLQAMQALCHEHDALFVLDEVQTGVRHDRHRVGLPAARRAARRRLVRQEAAGLRDHGRRARRRGARQRVRHVVADQLHLGRQPHRHGPLPPLPRDHRAGRADRARRGHSASWSWTSFAGSPVSTTSAAAACSSPSTCRRRRPATPPSPGCTPPAC